MKRLIYCCGILTMLLLSVFRTSAQIAWTGLDGPSGRAVTCFQALDNGGLLAGTEAGLFRSDDQGNTWVPFGMHEQRIHSIYAGPNKALLIQTDYGIFNGTQTGWDWTHANLDFKVYQVYPFGPVPDLLAATEQGIYRLVQGNWQPFALAGVDVHTLIVNQKGHLLAGTDKDIRRSVDGGLKWSIVHPMEYPVTCFAMNAQGVLFAGNLYYGVQRSTDDGANWDQVNSGLNYFDVRDLEMDPQGVLYAAHSGGLFRTYNNGDQWYKVGEFYTPLNAIHFGSGGWVYLGTRGYGIYSSWNDFNNYKVKLSKLGIYELQMRIPPQADPKFLMAGTENGIFRMDLETKEWQVLGLLYRRVWSLSENPQGMLFAGTDEGVFSSKDEGQIWEAAGLEYHKIFSLAWWSKGLLYAGTEQGMHYSLDNGKTWNADGPQLVFQLKPVFDPAGNYAYFANDEGIYRSTGPGEPWQILGLSYKKIWSMAVSPDGMLLVGADDKVYRSEDQGLTWVVMADEIGAVRSMVFDPSGILFAALEGDGVWCSHTGGEDFVKVSEGLTDPWVGVLAVGANHTLYAGTWVSGVFHSSSVTAVRESGTGQAIRFFPNPATDVLHVLVPQTGGVPMTISIRDCQGKLVRRFESGIMNGGLQEVNAGDLPSGLYSLQCHLENRIHSGKFLVIRR